MSAAATADALRATLLVELLTEELPPQALRALGVALAAGVHQALVQHDLADPGRGHWRSCATPRRLALLIEGVRAQAPPRAFVHKLVPVQVGLDAQGRATPALRRKLESLGLPLDLEALERADDERGMQTLQYRGIQPGLSLTAGLQSALQSVSDGLPIPKLMSYQLADGVTTVHFARPVHALVALHGTAVLAVELLGLQAGRTTAGHRFHAPGALTIESADDYEGHLRTAGKVLASFEQRRAQIHDQLVAAGARLQAQVVMPEALVDEVCALVEWPVVYESAFDAQFLTVPRNCLILTMQQHQKYFALQDAHGQLLNRFLLVSNIAATDPAAIIAGNARVLRARLADARFFFEQDQLRRLESRLEAAGKVVYHRKLGVQALRIARLVALADGIAAELEAAGVSVDGGAVRRAALLAKADLTTLMVAEFPELQGEMGGIYARLGGEPEAVAAAIEEHYRPRHAGDAIPASMVGACVALADKLETLAGLFGVGERASGEGDPYALRRNALGVLRILEEKSLPLELPRLLSLAFEVFAQQELPPGYARCEDVVEHFCYERLRGMLLERGYGARAVAAVLSRRPGRIDQVGRRLAALQAFMQLPESAKLATANKRIDKLLRKSAAAAAARRDASLLLEPAEQALAVALDAVVPAVTAAQAQGDDAAVLAALIPLCQPVDRFFDEVMVLVEEPHLRANRLALLDELRALMNRIVDLSQLAAG